MSKDDAEIGDPILTLVSGRPGHFCLESGHHSQLWFDLDGLFVQPARIAPFVERLAELLRAHDVTVVCGPLVGGAFLAQSLARELPVEFAFTERVFPAGRQGLYRAEYRLPAALRARVRGKRVAVVDDVVSAGSAVRGTCADLKAHGARPAIIGALLLLGSLAAPFFAQENVPVTSLARLPYEIWTPEACPLCAHGLPLENMAGVVYELKKD